MASPLVLLAAAGGLVLLGKHLLAKPPKSPVVMAGTGFVAREGSEAVAIEWEVLRQPDGYFTWRFFTLDETMSGFYATIESPERFKTADAAYNNLVTDYALVPTTAPT